MLYHHFLHRAFTGELWDNKEPGVYRCVVCGKKLFLSDTKFESGSGWPSFYETAEDGNVRKITDTSHGMTRIEVTCADVSFSQSYDCLHSRTLVPQTPLHTRIKSHFSWI